MEDVKQEAQSQPPANQAEDPWELNEIVRLRRIREDAKRPLAVNLAEGLALSEFLAGFTGICHRQ